MTPYCLPQKSKTPPSVIQGPAHLPQQPPASPPSVPLLSLCISHVDTVTCPESPSHTAQPPVNAHISEVTGIEP